MVGSITVCDFKINYRAKVTENWYWFRTYIYIGGPEISPHNYDLTKCQKHISRKGRKTVYPLVKG